MMTGEQTTLLLIYSTCAKLLVFREIRNQVGSDGFFNSAGTLCCSVYCLCVNVHLTAVTNISTETCWKFCLN